PITGLPPELYPKTDRAFFELVHPDDRMHVQENIERSRKKGDYEAEFRIVVGGDTRWVSALGRCMYDAQGEAELLTAVDLDITQRKQAEAAEMAYQQKLQSLSSRLLLLEETQRRSFAQMLHDHIGQNLTYTRIRLAVLATQVQGTATVSVDELVKLVDQ